MRRVISLTTDFGLDDTYVGTMKGAILAIASDVQIVDLTHSVEPGNLIEAALLVGMSYEYFPKDTIHVVVVDPGVGTERRAIAVSTPAGMFVAPDNGVLSRAIGRQLNGKSEPRGGRCHLDGTAIEAVALTDPRFWSFTALRKGEGRISATFHGRDVFGPVAAHLARGVPLERLGQAIDEIITLDLPRPEKRADGAVVGHIIHIDHFGNIITDLTSADLAEMPGEPVFEIVGRSIAGLSHNYQEKSGLLALLGSSGQIEIAASGHSAARELAVRKTDVVVVRATF